MRIVMRVLVLSLSFLTGVVRVEAAPILGIPVGYIGGTTQVGLDLVRHDPTPDGTNNGSDGWIRYYIPLNWSTRGTYGYTDHNGTDPCEQSRPRDCAGTYADTGRGNSYLDMFLMFSPVNTTLLEGAELNFEFSDLDLNRVNDPVGFFETVRIYSANGDAISRRFTEAPSATETGVFSGINYELTREPQSVSNYRNYPVNLSLWGDGLEALITDPFWVHLRFTTPANLPYGTNTAEHLLATLETANGRLPPQVPAVPEPATLLLLAAGLAVSARSLRRRPNN